MDIIVFLQNYFTNTIEAVNLYSLFAVLNHTPIRFTKKTVLLLNLWICSMSLFSGILSNTTTGFYAYKVIANLSILVIMYLCCKNDVYELYIMFVSEYTIILVIQFIIMIVIVVSPISLSDNKVTLIGQGNTLLVVSIICYKFPDILYENWKKLKDNPIIQIIFFNINFVIIGILISNDFKAKEMKPYIILYVVIIAICLYGFFKLAKHLIKLCDTMPQAAHDFNNSLANINAIIHNAAYSKETMQEKIMQQFDMVDFKVVIENELDCISNFIQSKEIDGTKINYHVFYQQENILLSDNIINKLLGILIDNAIEASQFKTVYVDSYVNVDDVIIKVKNDYMQLDIEQFEEAFSKGNTSKSSTSGHGYGLYHLNKIVDKYDGTIDIFNQYDKIQKIWYVVFQLEFSNCIRKKRN